MPHTPTSSLINYIVHKRQVCYIEAGTEIKNGISATEKRCTDELASLYSVKNVTDSLPDVPARPIKPSLYIRLDKIKAVYTKGFASPARRNAYIAQAVF